MIDIIMEFVIVFYFRICDGFRLSSEMNKCQNFLFDITLKDKLNYPNGKKVFYAFAISSSTEKLHLHMRHTHTHTFH